MANVIFSKRLAKADVENSLSIAACYLGPVALEEGDFMNMHVEDDSSQEWKFPCWVEGNGKSGKVVLVGWTEFASRRNVRVDDKVLFVEQDNGKIKIEVKRKIRLLGQDIWAPVK